MKKKKLLEFGAEGGSVIFYNLHNTEKEGIVIEGDQIGRIGEEQDSEIIIFDCLMDAVEYYSKRHDGLLHYYPMFIHPKVVATIKRRLCQELADTTGNSKGVPYFTIDQWERLIGSNLTPQDSTLTSDETEQKFDVRPLEQVNRYEYKIIDGEREVVQIIKTFRDQPEQKKIIQGIGELTGKVFLVRNRKNKIIGIYPLDQYMVSPID